MTEPGSGPEQPDEPPALGREFRRPDASPPQFDVGSRRRPTERTPAIESPEVIDEDLVESPDAADIEGIVEVLRSQVEQDPPSLGDVWDDITQQTLATYWPDED